MAEALGLISLWPGGFAATDYTLYHSWLTHKFVVTQRSDLRTLGQLCLLCVERAES